MSAYGSRKTKIIGWYRVTRRLKFWLMVGVLFLVFLYLIRSILLPFVVGGLAAYFLDPGADKLEARGLSRTLATSILTACFFLLLIVFFVWIPPVLVDQFSGLVLALPEYINTLFQRYDSELSHWLGALPETQMDSIKQAATDASGSLFSLAGNLIGGVFQSGVVIVNLLALLLITPVVTFYLLRDWDSIMERLDALLPRTHAGVIRTQFRIIDRTLAGFLRGQMNVCFLLSLYYAIGLSLTGLKFGIVIGIITGLLVILPYAGFFFGLALGLGVAFFQFESYGDIALVLAVFSVGMVLEGNFLTPKLVGEKVGLHPLWIIFGMLAGGALFGFVGVLIAVPVTAVVGVFIRFAIERYLESSYYRGERPLR